MTYLERIGPIYDLLGTRLQDLDGACGDCGKRLAEVIDDTTGQWNTGQVVCVDCGTTARTSRPEHSIRIVPSWRSAGMRVASCTCRWHSAVVSPDAAQRLAEQHRTQHARGAA